MPAWRSRRVPPPEFQKRSWVYTTGIEDGEDLIADLENGFPGSKRGIKMSVIAQAGAKGRQLHKFGGSSLADAKCYLRVAGIAKEYSQAGDMMVVSAAAKAPPTS